MNILICLFLLLFMAESEWSEVSDESAIFSMQGRRPGNEDRAVMKQVEMIEGLERKGDSVHIWAVMDGHGGNVSLSLTFEKYVFKFFMMG